MDAKSIFLYPGIILRAGWITLNGIKMYDYIKHLRNEKAECMASNPYNYQITLLTFLILFLFKTPIET
jgi:hypothetical protein